MKRISIALLLVWSCLSAAQAEWVPVGSGAGVDVMVQEDTPERISLELTLGGFDRTDVLIDGRVHSHIALPGEARLLEGGQPELPLVARSVIIPDTRLMELRVVSAEYRDLDGIVPAPSKGNLARSIDPAKIPYTFGDVYKSSSWYPEQPAFAREAYILRDYRGTTVVLQPIQYQPSTGTLRVYTRLVVELVDRGPGGANVLLRDAGAVAVNADFTEIYANHFLNYGGEGRYQQVSETGQILVLCHDAFAGAMQPYVDWKNRMGVLTTLVPMSQVGSTTTAVRDYIQTAYNTMNNPRLAAVLLVGDAPQIPSPMYSGSASDPTYSKVAGSDNYPDIFIGRMSAENVDHVTTQVARTINYESNPLLAGGDWYPKGVGIASNQGPGDDGEYDNQHIDRIRGMLMGYGYTTVDQIYDPNGNAQQLTNALNNGRTVINYCGHGYSDGWVSSGFNVNHVRALQNDHKLPFIFSVACNTGQFNDRTCFAEVWLRSTRNNNPIGAAAAYMSTRSQAWNPPMCAQDESARLLVNDLARTFGSICYNGSCQMIDEYGGSGVTEFMNWHVFGDPMLRVRTQTPVAMSVSCPEYLDSDATSLELDVPGVPGALCGLSYQGQFLGSAITGSNGHATIALAGPLPEDGSTLDVTVTAYNRIPAFATVMVMPAAMPTLQTDPASLVVSVPLNSFHVDTLRVSNVGEPGSRLVFTAAFHTDEPGLPFVTINPTSGTIPAGESMDIAVRVNSFARPTGTYEGEIDFAYNPSQNATVPITVYVGDPAAVGDQRALPAGLSLAVTGPNPSASPTTLTFGLPTSGHASLVVVDAAGRTLRHLHQGPMEAGYRTVAWDGADDAGRPLASGLYFVRLNSGDERATARVLRIR